MDFTLVPGCGQDAGPLERAEVTRQRRGHDSEAARDVEGGPTRTSSRKTAIRLAWARAARVAMASVWSIIRYSPQ